MENKKINSIFLGQVRRKVFSCYYDGSEIYDTTEFVKKEKVYECELERPPLEKGEKIYIPDLDLTLEVESVIKSVDGSITYNTNYTIRTLEDAKTEKSLRNAKEDQIEKKQKILEEPKEKKLKVQYEEPDGISRCLGSTSDCSIIAFFRNNDIKLIDTYSGNSITLDNRTTSKLVQFLEYVKR